MRTKGLTQVHNRRRKRIILESRTSWLRAHGPSHRAMQLSGVARIFQQGGGGGGRQSEGAKHGGGGHSQTNVLPTRVQTPQKWTLNGVLRHIKFAPLNGVTPVLVQYPKWRTLLWYHYNTLNGVLCIWYTVQYPKYHYQ